MLRLSKSKSVIPSTESQPSNPGGHITDGNTSDASRWSTSGLPQSAIIDLGDTYSLTRMELYPYKSRDYQYSIEVSEDSIIYTPVVDRSTNTESGLVLTDNVSVNGRYVKITVTGGYTYTGSWCSLNELMVFGEEIVTIPVNNAPTIAAISDLSVFDNAGQQTINLSGISDGDGNTLTVTFTATSSNQNIVNNGSVNYASGNTTGTLTLNPVAAGTATIAVTVTDNGGTANGGTDTQTVSFTVMVEASVISVTGVSLDESNIALLAGTKSTLNETITPSNSSDPSVTWSTSDTSVVTVDANGLVTAVSAGNAVITVTTNDGGYTATCIATVSVPVSQGIVESVGSGTASNIAGYTGWDSELPIIFSGGNAYPGVNEIESSHPSDNYQGASGGSNVHFRAGYNGTGYFIVEGINTSVLNNPVLTFGIMYNSVTGKDNFGVFVSTDGVTWTELSDGAFPALSAWGLMTYENIPSAMNLRVKFEVAARKDIWIDDIIINDNSLKSATAKQTRFNLHDNLKISVYPNPVASNDFKVAIDGLGSNEDFTISIFDITGKMLYINRRNTKISSMAHSEISMKNTFRKGMYILKIDNGDITSQSKFIVR